MLTSILVDGDAPLSPQGKSLYESKDGGSSWSMKYPCANYDGIVGIGKDSDGNFITLGYKGTSTGATPWRLSMRAPSLRILNSALELVADIERYGELYTTHEALLSQAILASRCRSRQIQRGPSPKVPLCSWALMEHESGSSRRPSTEHLRKGPNGSLRGGMKRHPFYREGLSFQRLGQRASS